MLVVALCALLVAACGRSPESKKYATLDELRRSAVAAGLVCPQWSTDVRHDGSLQGTCSPHDIVVLFADHDQRDAAVQSLKDALDGGGLAYAALVGENWMINSPQAPDLAEKLGGELITGE